MTFSIFIYGIFLLKYLVYLLKTSNKVQGLTSSVKLKNMR